ncbi:MAG TPA: hypothetical protein VG272_11040 [Candidatus Acidoferrales bacterium]|jgi:hypothetical protein|nr:hypothetical protein [Candidatus Acidoferrales bacterium]
MAGGGESYALPLQRRASVFHSQPGVRFHFLSVATKLSARNKIEGKIVELEAEGALGPFRLVAPHEKRPARWVEMVKSITVVRVP